MTFIDEDYSLIRDQRRSNTLSAGPLLHHTASVPPSDLPDLFHSSDRLPTVALLEAARLTKALVVAKLAARRQVIITVSVIDALSSIRIRLNPGVLGTTA